MRLVHRERIKEFVERFKDSGDPLDAWAKAVEHGDFKHFIELKQAFGDADYVKPYVVFNIAGNRYRLIAVVHYGLGFVSIETILTHAQYDRKRWRR